MEFSLSRFSQLLRRDFILHGRKILLSILFLILMLTILSFIGHKMISIEAGGAIQVIMLSFFGFLVFVGGFFTSSNLGDLKTAARRTQYLALPASSFEKVLSKWLYTLVIFLGIGLIIFYSFAFGYIAIFSDSFPNHTLDMTHKITSKIFPFFSMLYIIGHSIAFFFSFVFNSFAAVKGGLLFIAGFVLLSIIISLFDLNSGRPYDMIWGETVWKMMVTVQDNLKRFLVIAPIFWLLAYFVFVRKTA